MLIQGGTISSGRFSTFSVVGAYWISCIRSFWKTTLPGVTAMFSPTLEGLHVGHLDAQLALAALEIAQQVVQALQQVLAAGLGGLAQHLGIGQQEIRRAHRIDELARVEIDLLRGLRVEPVDLRHHVLHAARRQQVGLLDEVEDLVLLPGVVLEAAVRRRRRRSPARSRCPSCAARCSARASCSPARSRAAPAPAGPGWPSAAPSSP